MGARAAMSNASRVMVTWDPQLVKSGGQDRRPVQTCPIEYPYQCWHLVATGEIKWIMTNRNPRLDRQTDIHTHPVETSKNSVKNRRIKRFWFQFHNRRLWELLFTILKHIREINNRSSCPNLHCNIWGLYKDGPDTYRFPKVSKKCIVMGYNVICLMDIYNTICNKS